MGRIAGAERAGEVDDRSGKETDRAGEVSDRSGKGADRAGEVAIANAEV